MTSEQTAEIIRLRDTERLHWKLIAKALGIPTIGIARHYNKVKRAAEGTELAARMAKRKQRSCMTCAGPFMSEGPHNRMCNGCRLDSPTPEHSSGYITWD